MRRNETKRTRLGLRNARCIRLLKIALDNNILLLVRICVQVQNQVEGVKEASGEMNSIRMHVSY